MILKWLKFEVKIELNNEVFYVVLIFRSLNSVVKSVSFNTEETDFGSSLNRRYTRRTSKKNREDLQLRRQQTYNTLQRKTSLRYDTEEQKIQQCIPVWWYKNKTCIFIKAKSQVRSSLLKIICNAFGRSGIWMKNLGILTDRKLSIIIVCI